MHHNVATSKTPCFRAIDIQVLIGNVGGYIGLCLGYSFLQIPDFFVYILSKTRFDLSRLTKNKIASNSEHPITYVETGFDNARSSNNSSTEGSDETVNIACTSTEHDKLYEIIKRLEGRVEFLENNN